MDSNNNNNNNSNDDNKKKPPPDDDGAGGSSQKDGGKKTPPSAAAAADEEASNTKGGTIATIPPNNNTNSAATNAATATNQGGYGDEAIFDEVDQPAVQPGVMFVPGPEYTGLGLHTGYDSNDDDNNNDNDENSNSVIVSTNEIIQGFIVEGDGSSATTGGSRSQQQQRQQRKESTRERIQRLIDNAVTLDDSAVKPINDDNDDEIVEGDDGTNNNNNNSSGGRDENNIGENGNIIRQEVQTNGTSSSSSPQQNNNTNNNINDEDDNEDEIKSDRPYYYQPWFIPLLVIVICACIVLAIALPLSLRDKSTDTNNFGGGVNGNGGKLTPTANNDDDICGTSSTTSFDLVEGNISQRYNIVKSILSSITSSEILDDETSPQGKAIRWIVCYDIISTTTLDNNIDNNVTNNNNDASTQKLELSGNSGYAQLIRRYILSTFIYSTSLNEEWKDKVNFLTPNLHECGWHVNYTRQNFPFGEFDPVGVICASGEDGYYMLNDDDKPFDFMTLNIRIDNNMNGPLPPEIGYLVDLRSLMLENQFRLTGQLPSTMGNMTKLHDVALLLNGLGGEVPSGLFQLTNLISIQLEQNLGEQWSLPDNVQVGNDTQFERLLLGDNKFGGRIPSWIDQLSQLKTLDLHNNNFEGAIPEEMGNLSSIKYLNLLRNDLTGAIPTSLGQLNEIDVMILAHNKLKGELPASLGNLQMLQLLDVSSNALTSAIPSSFANLESMKYLVLESNKFDGPVDVLGSMKNLTVLLIRSNSFSGALPEGMFSEISDDVIVDVGDNKFIDKLPASFGNMTNLVSLIGARNSFDENATQTAVCENTTLLVMDCDSCECCDVCCDGGNDGVCDFQLDVSTLLGYACGAWYKYCLSNLGFFVEEAGKINPNLY